MLYKEKLDLELDAQRKMVAALEERAGAARGLDDPDIAERIARAKETLGNLEKRAGDLARIGPLERQLLAWGVLQPAPWLDQPARLFAEGRRRPPRRSPGQEEEATAPTDGAEDVSKMARHADHFAVDVDASRGESRSSERDPRSS